MKVEIFETGIKVSDLRIIITNEAVLYRPKGTIAGRKWYDEYSDSDMFTPSCPHLHSQDGKYKMNVYTGELYNIRNKIVDKRKKIHPDDLALLWNDEKFCDFADTMRKLYLEKFPNGSLPDIPQFPGKHRIKQRIYHNYFLSKYINRRSHK